MFATSNASRSFTSLTIDEIRWLNASKALGDDGDSVYSLSSTDLVKSQSVAIPKSARPRCTDTRRRSILLDDFLGSSNTSSRSVDSSKTRFGFKTPSSRSDTSPPSPDEILPTTPPRAAPYSAAHSIQGEMPSTPPRPTEWLYRRPRSPSTLSRSPSSQSSCQSSISRTPSSSRSVTPTPSRLRTPTGYRPHTPTTAVTEMNISPFYSTVVPPLKRAPSIRAGCPTSHGRNSPSRSSPNLLDFRASPRSKNLASRPPLPMHRERSGSESSISTTSTSSLPRTPPSPSIYSQHSFAYPHQPDTRSTTPTKSILSPKRSPSISTKHSSTSKSVKFDEVSARYVGDHNLTIGDGKVRGEEWNSRVLDGVECMGMDVDGMDVFEDRETQTPTPLGKAHGGALKRFLTLRTRTKNKLRPEISGPFALAPATTGSPRSTEHAYAPAETRSLSAGSLPPSPSRYLASASASFIHNDVDAIPSSPNGGPDLGASPAPKHKARKPSSLLGPGEQGVLPDHGRFLSATKFYTHPARYKPTRAASITSSASVGLLASEPVLHALPSMESFRSVKSTRSCSRFKGWLGRIGIGVAA